MEAFKTFKARAAYLNRPNIDTDLIIPKQFLKSIKREGFGANLFNDLRFDENGRDNPDFILNKPRYEGAGFLAAGENFGCGSSREHATWALLDYGFRAIIAPSFGDIFRNNSSKVGLLLIQLPADEVAGLCARIEENDGYELEANVETQKLSDSRGWVISFEIDPYVKKMLMGGQDQITLTLAESAGEIEAYEKSHAKAWQAALPKPA
ncbi:MAG: 3-isopropylmalate dehydratase small subunit [Deltaproteobacteria bacterium]|jgi:3-isopropylmalate/(R)-2-methylmalate dehydratase small subunit|nr:3-isopropylmalate dehydratase small subunit [Deltaproteobacteria bacterium]